MITTIKDWKQFKLNENANSLLEDNTKSYSLPTNEAKSELKNVKVEDLKKNKSYTYKVKDSVEKVKYSGFDKEENKYDFSLVGQSDSGIYLTKKQVEKYILTK